MTIQLDMVQLPPITPDQRLDLLHALSHRGTHLKTHPHPATAALAHRYDELYRLVAEAPPAMV